MATAGGMESAAAARATVRAANGEPVKLRKLPGKHSEYLAKVPVGTTVEVLEAGSEWCTVVAQGQRGYMMRAFLEMEGLPADESTLEERVTALEARMLALEAGVRG